MKYIKVIIGACIVGVVLFLGWKKLSTPQVLGLRSPSVSVKINDISYGYVSADTPFDALLQVEADVEKKQYDFGVFVEAVGDRKNTSELSWIYFVNNESGDMAADKKILHEGDVVEWRYIKSTY